MTFKVGDKIRCVKDQYIWFDHEDNYNNILTVIGTDDGMDYVNEENNTIEVGAFENCATNAEDFVKVEDQYFAGIGVVTEDVTARAEPARLPKTFIGGAVIDVPKGDVQVVTLPYIIDKPELGVFRPNLEDRKVGKVPMHMVVDGFPNALKAVGEVMGWAADVKGYKLHDWRNLPNAGTELPAAEYRHSNENAIQKVEGLKALDRVDHESNKLHIAHKVFNALAELELVLCGKIE